MLKFLGSVIKEQGVTFAVVAVQPNVIDNHAEADKYVLNFQRSAFPGVPVVLLAVDSRGSQRCYGRPDIAKFMANVPLAAIPWKEYTLS